MMPATVHNDVAPRSSRKFLYFICAVPVFGAVFIPPVMLHRSSVMDMHQVVKIPINFGSGNSNMDSPTIGTSPTRHTMGSVVEMDETAQSADEPVLGRRVETPFLSEPQTSDESPVGDDEPMDEGKVDPEKVASATAPVPVAATVLGTLGQGMWEVLAEASASQHVENVLRQSAQDDGIPNQGVFSALIGFWATVTATAREVGQVVMCAVKCMFGFALCGIVFRFGLVCASQQRAHIPAPPKADKAHPFAVPGANTGSSEKANDVRGKGGKSMDLGGIVSNAIELANFLRSCPGMLEQKGRHRRAAAAADAANINRGPHGFNVELYQALTRNDLALIAKRFGVRINVINASKSTLIERVVTTYAKMLDSFTKANLKDILALKKIVPARDAKKSDLVKLIVEAAFP